MKKLITTVVALMSVALCYAQEISQNEVNEEGTRIISTEPVLSYNEDCVLMWLEYHKNMNIENYYLAIYLDDVYDSLTIRKGQELLIKTGDGEKLTAIAAFDAKKEIAKLIKGGAGYVAYVIYVISPEDVDSLKSGISKIRVNYISGGATETFYDIVIDQEEVARYMKKAIKNISQAKSLPPDIDKSEF